MHKDALLTTAASFCRRFSFLQVIAEQAERLRALLQLTHYCLAAAVRNDLDLMLPLFGLYLPNAWQLSIDCLASSHRLMSTCKVCNTTARGVFNPAPGSGGSQQGGRAPATGGAATGRGVSNSNSSSSAVHLGPQLASVLRMLLDSLPTAWQCFQRHLQQDQEQRRLYMASLNADESAADDSQGAFLTSSQQQSQGSARAEQVLSAELQSKQKWVVHLLQLGGELHTLRTSSGSGSGGSRRSSFGFGGLSGSGGSVGGAAACSECFDAAVGEQQLLQAWRGALEGVVRVTSTPWSKVRLPNLLKCVS
jgi:uncharacterized membrane protein YgcG